jgi:transposase
MSRKRINMLEVKEILYRYQRGKKKRALAQTLGISRTTLKDIIKMAQTYGFNMESSEEDVEEISIKVIQERYQQGFKLGSSKSKLSIYHKQIEDWKEQAYMTNTQIARLLSMEGLTTTESSVRRYIKANFKTIKDSTIRLLTIAGEQAQVDYSYVGKIRDGVKMRKCYAFVMTLSHSRYRFVKFVFRQDSNTWIDCHIQAFEFFGGVPRTIILDNLKSGVTKTDIYDPIINRSYGELERHYNFIADPAKVRAPRHKGKVERSVGIVKQQLIAGCNYANISEANKRAIKWCRYEISQRICRSTGKTPWELFTLEEKSVLQGLPELRYEDPTWHVVKVHRDNHVVVEGSFYSAPYAYLGMMVVVRCSNKLVQIFYQERLIKVHSRAENKGSWVTDQNDYPKNAQIFLSCDKEACLKKAETIGKATYSFCEQILSKPSIIAKRKAQAILRCAERYTPERLEAACKRALEYDNFSYKCIDSILKNNLEGNKEREKPIRKISLETSYLRDPKEFSHYNTEAVHGK